MAGEAPTVVDLDAELEERNLTIDDITAAVGKITVGAVATGAPGTAVIVTSTPTDPGIELDFTIPRGDVGDVTPAALAALAAALLAQARAETAAASAGADAVYAKTRMVTDVINTEIAFAEGDDYGFVVRKVSVTGQETSLSLKTGAADVDSLQIRSIPGFATLINNLTVYTGGNAAILFALTDDYGFANFKIDQNGITTTGGVTAAGAVTGLSAAFGSIALSEIPVSPNSAGILSAWVDDYGFATVTISPSGVKSASAQGGNAAAYLKGNWSYERLMWAIYGQSVAIGMKALPALTTAQLYGSTMLSTGMRTEGVNVSAATLVPAVEVDDNTNLLGETPVSGAMACVNQLIASENGIAYTDHSFQMTGFAPGKSSQPISALVKGSAPYTGAMAVIDRIIALSPNTPIGMQGFGWVQGESDAQAGTPFETYITALRGLRTDWDADVKARTAQPEDVHLFTSQVSSHIYYGQAVPMIALAQLEASVRDAFIHCVCPLYQMDYADNVHLTNVSEKWLGAYIGFVYWWVVIMGFVWKPLCPTRKIIRGTAIDLIFNVPKPPWF
jgi:hypothetical protein